MTIEILKKPIMIAEEGVTYQVLVVDRPEQEIAENQVQLGEVESLKRQKAIGIGIIATSTGVLERYLDDDTLPYKVHPTTHVQGFAVGDVVYNKRVLPNGAFGIPLPFYGLRIAFAQKRASRLVKQLLHN